jgi:hypothetical protein
MLRETKKNGGMGCIAHPTIGVCQCNVASRKLRVTGDVDFLTHDLFWPKFF